MLYAFANGIVFVTQTLLPEQYIHSEPLLDFQSEHKIWRRSVIAVSRDVEVLLAGPFSFVLLVTNPNLSPSNEEQPVLLARVEAASRQCQVVPAIRSLAHSPILLISLYVRRHTSDSVMRLVPIGIE